MILLRQVPRDDLARLSKLRQNPGQYANDGAEMILDPTPGITFHEIRQNDETVGMFKLDPLYHQRHDFAGPSSLGLRGMLIDRAHQGRGIAQVALGQLPTHARDSYPWAREIVLTVNLLNPAGYAAYLKAGFADLGQIYYGGGRGPQHILRLPLPQET